MKGKKLKKLKKHSIDEKLSNKSLIIKKKKICKKKRNIHQSHDTNSFTNFNDIDSLSFKSVTINNDKFLNDTYSYNSLRLLSDFDNLLIK